MVPGSVFGVEWFINKIQTAQSRRFDASRTLIGVVLKRKLKFRLRLQLFCMAEPDHKQRQTRQEDAHGVPTMIPVSIFGA